MRWVLAILTLTVIVALSLYILPDNAKAPTNNGSPSNTVLTTTRGNTDIIRNVSIEEGDKVSSPLTITGEARGNWYFEASFPIALTDWDGRIIAEVPAQAQSDWMTTEYVPFKAVLTFETPAAGDPAVNRGALILQKDNASGLPEHDDAFEIQVVF